MAGETLPCPYIGLRPFRESDYPFFFGRDREIRIVSSNLQARPLTVLYGPSGVGKSSVLQAGVLPHLTAVAGQAVVYFNEWQSAAFLSELGERCRHAAPSAFGNGDGRLDDALGQAGRFFLLLDQFEEYLLYHTEEAGQEFDAILARIVNREDVPAKVLIGIREDALSKLDQRFGIRIPNLLGNTLAIQHLDAPAAREAIRRPLAVFNDKYPEAGRYRIEPELVEEILKQVQAGQVTSSESSGRGSAAGNASENRIETAFLQLVLTRLWSEESRAGSRTLRLETLSKIGGAGSIVQKHVADVMAQFPSVLARDIAARIFQYLVTPSRTKIAQSTPDLVSFGEAPAEDVKNVLSTLTDRPDTRIMRRLANPERYEIFHDVLAQPILDWRRAHLLEKDRAAEQEKQAAEAELQRRELEQTRALAKAEQERLAAEAELQRRELEQTRALAVAEKRRADAEAELQRRELEQTRAVAAAEKWRAEAQARSAKRLRWMLAAVMIALLLAAGAAVYAFQQRQQARNLAKVLEYQKTQAEAAKALAAQKEAEAAEAQLQGKDAEAKSLRAEAKQLSAQALQTNQQASVQKEQLSAAAEGRDKEYRDALQQIDTLKQQIGASQGQLQQAQTERDQMKGELQQIETLKQQLSTSEGKLKQAQADRDQLKGQLDTLQKASSASPNPQSGPQTNPKDGLTYVWIPPPASGTFLMGCSPGDAECYPDEKLPHAEQIANGFWLGQTEVTQAAWKKVNGGDSPSHFKGDQLPVENVNWNQAGAYCKAIGGRLPTEKEWEYAARAGTTGARYGSLDGIAWNSGDSRNTTHPVSLKPPNAFGLYDMLGNVWEWVADDWAAYPGGSITACKGCKVVRGGSWDRNSMYVRASDRHQVPPSTRSSDIGFRCVGDFR